RSRPVLPRLVEQPERITTTTSPAQRCAKEDSDVELYLPVEETITSWARPLASGASETVLDELERFGQLLRQCDQARQQIRLILHSLDASLGADALFWHPG